MKTSLLKTTNEKLDLTNYKKISVEKALRLVNEITEKVEIEPTTILDKINHFGIKNGVQKQRGEIVEMALFYGMNKIWHKLPLEQRENYNNDFYIWCNYIRVEGGEAPQAQKTLDGRIRVFKSFYSNEKVRYTKTLPNPNDGGKFCNVEEELKAVPPTKLLVATGFVNREGRIPNDVLKVILDDKKSKTDVQEAIADYNLGYELSDKVQKEEQKQKTVVEKEYLYSMADGIYFHNNGTSVKLYDVIKQPTTLHHIKGSKMLLQPHNINHHYNGIEEYDEEMPEDSVYTDSQGIICLTDGLTIFRFTKEDALSLANMLKNEAELKG